VPYAELVASADVVAHKLEFLDKGGKEVGHINISTQYIWAEPDPVAAQSASPDVEAGPSKNESNYDQEMFEDSVGKRGPTNPSLDKKSILKIIIKEASFLKDSDFFGKQDPYIKFKYNNVDLQTTVKDDAGKQAKWDETFMLPNVYTKAKNNETLEF